MSYFKKRKLRKLYKQLAKTVTTIKLLSRVYDGFTSGKEVPSYYLDRYIEAEQQKVELESKIAYLEHKYLLKGKNFSILNGNWIHTLIGTVKDDLNESSEYKYLLSKKYGK